MPRLANAAAICCAAPCCCCAARICAREARPDLMVPRTMNRVRAIAGACCGDPDALAAGSALMPLAACECEGIEIADIAIAQLRIPSRVREVLRVLIGYLGTA